MGKKKKKEKKKVNDGDDDSVRVEKIRFDLIPAPPNVNRGIGKCQAMGDDCLNSHLENERHICKDCEKWVHAIGCCVDTGTGTCSPVVISSRSSSGIGNLISSL